jgi:hypothetical protein
MPGHKCIRQRLLGFQTYISENSLSGYRRIASCRSHCMAWPMISVRDYDADDMCIYALGDVCDGTDVEWLLDRALADRRTD